MTLPTRLLGGAAVAMLLTTGVAFAQTSGTGASSTYDTTNTNTTGASGTTNTSGAVGTPNTGSGGDTAINVALLGGSAVIAAGGAAMLMRRRYR